MVAMQRNTDQLKKKGFTLVEIALAMLVMAVGVMGVFSLLPVGLTANRNAINDSRIALIAESVLAELRAEMMNNYSDDGGNFSYVYNDDYPGEELRPYDPTQGEGPPEPTFFYDGDDLVICNCELRVEPVYSGSLSEATLTCAPGQETGGERLVFYTRFANYN